MDRTADRGQEVQVARGTQEAVRRPQGGPGEAGRDVLPVRRAGRGARLRSGADGGEERAELLQELVRVGQRRGHAGRGAEEVTPPRPYTSPDEGSARVH